MQESLSSDTTSLQNENEITEPKKMLPASEEKPNSTSIFPQSSKASTVQSVGKFHKNFYLLDEEYPLNMSKSLEEITEQDNVNTICRMQVEDEGVEFKSSVNETKSSNDTILSTASTSEDPVSLTLLVPKIDSLEEETEVQSIQFENAYKASPSSSHKQEENYTQNTLNVISPFPAHIPSKLKFNRKTSIAKYTIDDPVISNNRLLVEEEEVSLLDESEITATQLSRVSESTPKHIKEKIEQANQQLFMDTEQPNIPKNK